MFSRPRKPPRAPATAARGEPACPEAAPSSWPVTPPRPVSATCRWASTRERSGSRERTPMLPSLEKILDGGERAETRPAHETGVAGGHLAQAARGIAKARHIGQRIDEVGDALDGVLHVV